MNPDLPPPNRAIGWYRFIVWAMPTCVSVALLFVMETSSLRVSPAGALFLAMGATCSLGYFDALLGLQQRGIPRDSPESHIPRRVVIFTLLQILIVPVLWLAAIWGICTFLVK